MNQKILELIDTYPTKGEHPYLWVSGTHGVTRDLIYKGESILKTDSKKSTFCSGITFEVWFRAAVESGIDISVKEMRRIQRLWFITDPKKRRGPLDALSPDYGEEIKSIYKCEPGDFVQIWRQNGSGHTVIFKDIINKAGFTYWSTQPVTKGIGVRNEFWVPKLQKNPITEIHCVRAKT